MPSFEAGAALHGANRPSSSPADLRSLLWHMQVNDNHARGIALVPVTVAQAVNAVTTHQCKGRKGASFAR